MMYGCGPGDHAGGIWFRTFGVEALPGESSTVGEWSDIAWQSSHPRLVPSLGSGWQRVELGIVEGRYSP